MEDRRGEPSALHQTSKMLARTVQVENCSLAADLFIHSFTKAKLNPFEASNMQWVNNKVQSSIETYC